VGECILALDPDVVVLTEYVPGSCRAAFIEQLRFGGLANVVMSEAPGRDGFNHVLIAAREPLSRGRLAPPGDIDHHVPANALHV
jgi:hypothetical protein